MIQYNLMELMVSSIEGKRGISRVSNAKYSEKQKQWFGEEISPRK